MDIISFNEAATANERIERFIENPDSSSGLVSLPKKISVGESVTIPDGRVVVHPNLEIAGTLTIEDGGELFVPFGGTLVSSDLMHPVDTIADLRNESGKYKYIYVTGYHTKDDGAFGSNMFVWDENSTETDNGGTIIKCTTVTTGRYKLKYSGAVNVKWFGNDATTALETIALDSSFGEVKIPSGITEVSRTIKWHRTVKIIGEGKGHTIIKAATGFTGIDIFEMGTKDTTTYLQGLSIQDVDFDCNNQDIAGFGSYGVRDGSYYRSIRVYNSSGTHIRTNFNGNGAGAMNEGVVFDNVHAITIGTAPAIGSVIWDLNGLFEATLLGCKCLSTGIVANITGFRLGHTGYSRGVQLLGCSVANIKGAGAIGIHYSQYADECWDEKTTFENLSGNAVVFAGSQITGINYPSGCETLNGRFYISAGESTWDYLVKFGNSAVGCTAHIPIDTVAKTLQFNGVNQQGNKAYITGAALVANLFTTKVDLKATHNTNYVEYICTNYLAPFTYKFFTGEAGDITNTYREYAPREHLVRHDRYGKTEKLGLHDKYLIEANNGNDIIEFNDAATRMYSSGTQTWQMDQYNNISFNTIIPSADNTLTLGTAAKRWSTIYAGTGTINTSDDREKTYIDITEIEKQVALELKANMKKFKYNDAIESKGEDKARIHFGASAQTIKAIFEKHGLNGFDYSILCYDEWEAEYETKVIEEAELDKEGNTIKEAIIEEVLVRESGNRYGIRYEELLCFIISAM